MTEYELEAACRDWLKIRPFQDEPTLLRLMDFVRFRERKAKIGEQDVERALIDALKPVLRQRDEAENGMEIAWGIIANAGGGDWDKETPEWREAAARWRDEYWPVIMAPLTKRLAAEPSEIERVHSSFGLVPNLGQILDNPAKSGAK
jgi:hypothetical protein